MKSAKASGPGRLLFFWDYDTQWGADRSRLSSGPQNWGNLEFENTERILELHDEFGVPACFAVVGAAALPGRRPYHDPDQIRLIHSAGHEIASHSFRHEWMPGLRPAALLKTLRSSKDALEQCIGAPVQTFVPPYNQPFDYSAGWSFSLSERRSAGWQRTDLGRLCDALAETGYQFCRVAYRPLHQRLAEHLRRERLDRPGRTECIGAVTCVRLNTPGGFTGPCYEQIRRAVDGSAIVVVYGHPHSLTSGNSQDERHLIPLLRYIRELQGLGKLQVCRPSELIQR